MILIGSSLFMSCSSEVHYDSVSTTLEVDLTHPEDYENVSIKQRYTFERNVSTISAMELDEAWLSSPMRIQKESPSEDSGDEASFDLEILKEIHITVYDPVSAEHILWLTVPYRALVGENVMFQEFDLGNLTQYLDAARQLEIRIEMSLNTYHAMRYWRDACDFEASCTLKLPLSIQFRMED